MGALYTSAQNSLLVYYSSAQQARTMVNLADAAGKSLLTFAPSKTYQSIVISMPELQQGQTYTLSSGGSCTETNVDGLFTGGTYSGGTRLANVTLSSALTSISDNGAQVSSSGNMGGRPGGQRPGQ